MKNDTPSEVYVHMADNGFWWPEASPWQQLYLCHASSALLRSKHCHEAYPVRLLARHSLRAGIHALLEAFGSYAAPKEPYGKA